MSQTGAVDELQRRGIRQSYRVLTKEIKDKKTKHTREGGGRELYGSIIKADEIYKSVLKPREQAADGEVYCQLAEHGLELIQTFQKEGATCTPEALLARLKQQHVPGWNPQTVGAEDGTAFNWAAFGTRVSRFFHTAPAFTCMLGPMDIQAKERKKAERQVRQAAVRHELVNPEQVTQGADAKQQETDRNILTMRGILKAAKRTPLARLINNPKSFGQTVENLFTLSFLVRNGQARYVYAADGSVDVEYTLQPTEDDFSNGSAEVGQFVFRLSMADWQEMQAHVGEPAFLVPHREYESLDGAGLGGVGAATPRASTSAASPAGEGEHDDSPCEQAKAMDRAVKGASRNRPRENSSQESPPRRRMRRS